MKSWEIAGATAAVAALWGCASSQDSRPLTPVERMQLIQAHQSAELRRDVGLDTAEHARCSSATGSARLRARQDRDNDVGALRNCPGAQPAGSPPSGAR